MSAPRPMVLTMNSNPRPAARMMPRPICCGRLRPRNTRRTGWRTGLSASIYACLPALDVHAHDFLIGVNQLVANLERHREAKAGLLGIEHDLMNVDRVASSELGGRGV